MKKTPLHANHLNRGAKMGPFGGWDMPIQYEGILAEHNHTRTACSLFDTCHMGEFDLRGPNAEADLERLLTQNIATLAIGQCRYGFMLNDEGGVIDDLTCYRRSDDHFFLVVNAGTLDGDAAWIKDHLSPDTVFTDLSPNRAKIDIQGPTSREALEKAFNTTLPELKYFRFTDTELNGVPCTLSRTGYTGEWGYEIYFSADHAVAFWDLILEETDAKPAGLGARDTLRLEMGYPLYGHELCDKYTPVAATRGTFISTKKDFIGKDAVEKDMDGVPRYLVGLKLDTKRAAREGHKVMKDGDEIGQVTSGSLSPSLGTAVAMAYVTSDCTSEGALVDVDIRGKKLPATVVPLPFYTEGTARKN